MAKKDNKTATPMMCVYAGPDSLYWKTGNLSDASRIDPDSETAKNNIGAADLRMRGVYAGPEAMSQPIPQPNIQAEKKKFCPECGAPNALVNRFCTECGTKLTYPDSDKQG